MEEIKVTELKQLLDNCSPLQLVDVREEHELKICKIEPSLHIPLGQIELRWKELDPNLPTVIYCRSGKRSATAVAALARLGIRAKNLVGGVLAWSDEIDPRMPKY